MQKIERVGLAVFIATFGLATTHADASVGPAATPAPVKCAIPKPCALFMNAKAGSALEGTSASGAGLTGSSSTGAGLYGISNSGILTEPGVEGESTNASGNDAAGIFGALVVTTGQAPEYGVLGFGQGYGVDGVSVNTGTFGSAGYGVYGEDNQGSASLEGDFNVGVFGTSIAGTGVLGESNGSPSVIYGTAPVGVYSVADTAAGTSNPNAFAFFGETNSFGMDIHNTSPGSNGYAFLLYPGGLIQAGGSTGNFTIDGNGNEKLSGTLTTSKGGPYVRTTGASGTAMIEYGERTTTPQVEDVGEGQLTSGRAYVSIDARLADTIDRRTVYHVFVTPEGDCNGLYVTQKSTAGFFVRELRGGRSTLAFEYRIVAKPLDENGARLAAAPPQPKPVDDGIKTVRSAPRPAAAALSPEERLKRRIGTQAYAEAVLQLRARQQAASTP